MLPHRGVAAEELLARLAEAQEADLPVRGGKVTAYVYDTGRPEVHEAGAAVYAGMLEVNMLDPTAFPSMVALEKDVVGAVAAELGQPGAPGIFTSGGTESIMLAVKAARDAAGIERPQMVVPVTAHPAFHKAAHYLGVEVVAVPVDLETFTVDPALMEAAITPQTVLVVVSAPSYPQGVIDPVEAVAALAAARGIPCHVDACVGGWLLPWLREAGAEVPPFDLSVPGVTSISCDLHKFGYAPKGASVLLFKDAALRRRAYFASAAWPGYTIINATVQSSRSAGPLGGAWGTLHALGREGYIELGRTTLEAHPPDRRGRRQDPRPAGARRPPGRPGRHRGLARGGRVRAGRRGAQARLVPPAAALLRRDPRQHPHHRDRRDPGTGRRDARRDRRVGRGRPREGPGGGPRGPARADRLSEPGRTRRPHASWNWPPRSAST